jgi:hypothetical protein
MIKKVIQSCPEPVEGKAAASLTRGAYFQYVSTTKWRERCWWLFSTFPKGKYSLAIKLRRALSCVMKQSMLIQIIQGRNAIGFFLDEQARRYANNHSIRVPRLPLCVLGVALAIGLTGCGPSKVALTKQFDARIGQNKDRLIMEIGLPLRDCTPLQLGEACEWQQTGGRGRGGRGRLYLEGPMEGTFPGDRLTYFLDSRGIVCQWRFEGTHNGTQHSASQC